MLYRAVKGPMKFEMPRSSPSPYSMRRGFRVLQVGKGYCLPISFVEIGRLFIEEASSPFLFALQEDPNDHGIS